MILIVYITKILESKIDEVEIVTVTYRG